MVTNHSTPLPATKIADLDALFADDVKPGSYFFEDGHIKFDCPCGCGSCSVLPVYRSGDAKPAPNAWWWDGNEDAPTLDPSIRQLGGCKFHGFLQSGTWTFAGDSGK